MFALESICELSHNERYYSITRCKVKRKRSDITGLSITVFKNHCFLKSHGDCHCDDLTFVQIHSKPL